MKIKKVILATICISLLAVVLINTVSHYSALGEALNSKRQSNWVTNGEIPQNLKVFFETSQGDGY